MLDKRRYSHFDDWGTRSMLTPGYEQVIFLAGGIALVAIAALVLSLL